MSVKIRLGKRIQELRHKFSYTQDQLSELMDISPKTLSWIENGRSFPTAKNIEAMASALNIDVADVLDIHSTKDLPDMKQEIFDMMNRTTFDEIKIIHKLLRSLLSK